MQRRIAELCIVCWSVDLDMTLAESAGIDPELSAAVLAAARNCRLQNKAVLRMSHDGLELLALPLPDGVVVADLAHRRAAPFSRDALIQVLKNYHADLQRAATDHSAIDGFNANLSQSYEEVNLLFRMARSLTSSEDAAQIVQTLSNELREVLGYRWLAVVFQGSELVLEPLRGAIHHSGELPCEQAEFRAHCTAIDPATADRVLSPTANALAVTSGSEVIAERLMDDETLIGVIFAGNRQGTDPDVSSGELQFTEAAASFLGLFHQNAFRFAEQRRLFFGTLNTLTAAVDAKDPYTRGHSERVALLASQLAAKLGLTPKMAEAIRIAGLLHDIGKIGVPEAVLRKPARLTAEEFDLIKQHPAIGHRILQGLSSLSFQLPGVLHHHERWDGRGYPHKLRGEAIPMVARILAFADTFDAMSSNRSYRSAIPRAGVLAEIRKSSGTQFDPDMVEQFLVLDFTEFDKLLAASAANALPGHATAA